MIPIKRVVLFKHGVGYFERRGKVSGNADVSFEFKHDQMNDVLKTLTALDLSGGAISSIAYDAKDDGRDVQGISLHIPQDEALSGLLAQLGGARIELIVAGEKIEGVVLGIERVATQNKDGVTDRSFISLLQKDRALSRYDIADVSWFNVLDDELRDDLKRLLEYQQRSQHSERKRLSLAARGSGERELLISYLVEAPVWKTSYRVLIGEDETRIQGWAMIDNTSDEDWEDVNVSLVAGLPISFRHNLYSPRYAQRPEVAVKQGVGYDAPLVAAGAELEEEESWEGAELRDSGAEALMSKVAPSPARMREKAAHFDQPKPGTATEERGALFEYSISDPVSVKSRQSALVPILFEPIHVEKVVLYSRGIRDANPLNALLLKNDTGLVLEGGPVTLLNGADYAGESMLEVFNKGEQRLLPYAVELRCKVTHHLDSESRDPYLLRIHKGRISLHAWHVQIRTYYFDNSVGEMLDVILEHPRMLAFDLVDTPEPFEELEDIYRFRFNVEAGQKLKFTVSQREEQSEARDLSTLDSYWVEEWNRKGYLSPEITGALRLSIARTHEIRQLESDVSERGSQIQQIAADQKRLRENLQALGESSGEKGLRDRYVKALGESEDRVDAQRKAVDEMRAKIEELTALRDSDLAKLDSEREIDKS